MATMLATTGGGTLLLDQLIPNTRDGGYHPHKTDFYIPTGTINFAVVSLPGGGGDYRQQARYENVLYEYTTPKQKIVNWSGLQKFNVMAVFPDSQHCSGPNMAYSVDANGNPLKTWPTGGNPWNPKDINGATPNFNGKTWSDGHMWSGCDDPQFLQDLSTFIKNTYTFLQAVYLCGHSNGGMMTTFMWYNYPLSYHGYATWAGPAPWYQDATIYPKGITPDTPMPTIMKDFLQIQGALDQTVGAADWQNVSISHLYDQQWSQNPSDLTPSDLLYPHLASFVGSWDLLQKRVLAKTGQVVTTADAVTTKAHVGNRIQYSYDLNAKGTGGQQLVIYDQATHKFESLTQCNGFGLLFGQLMPWIFARNL